MNLKNKTTADRGWWCWKCDLWHTETEFIEEWLPNRGEEK